MRFPRSSGVLAHITSLPGEYGIGDLGVDAFDFVQFLADAGQTIWQVLPLNPTAVGNSPYSCYSVFAGSPLLINLPSLVEDGWLDRLPDDVPPVGNAHDQADFVGASRLKESAIQKAFDQSRAGLAANDAYAKFCDESAWWLEDFAKFEAFMRHFGTADWTNWPAGLAQRQHDALSEWVTTLATGIERSKFVQFVFDQQWNRLKHHANECGVRMYGDLSIFVARESSDVWANQGLFHLDSDGQPTCVAGVPPDYFSETGQRWGNPLYRWDVMETNGFAWWTGRFRRAKDQFDLLRVDHFRGFESYWEIPATAESAVSGHWREGPGTKPFDAAQAALGKLPIIAEDLGMITHQVHELRDRLGFPPMRVMQFGFETEQDDFHRPNRYPEHCVAYTGTHDNDTTMGWLESRRQEMPENRLLEEWIEGESDIHLQLVAHVMNSAADTVVIPLQDLLGLGSVARMNRPGEADGNWGWRVQKCDLSDSLAKQIREMTQKAGR